MQWHPGSARIQNSEFKSRLPVHAFHNKALASLLTNLKVQGKDNVVKLLFMHLQEIELP